MVSDDVIQGIRELEQSAKNNIASGEYDDAINGLIDLDDYLVEGVNASVRALLFNLIDASPEHGVTAMERVRESTQEWAKPEFLGLVRSGHYNVDQKLIDRVNAIEGWGEPVIATLG